MGNLFGWFALIIGVNRILTIWFTTDGVRCLRGEEREKITPFQHEKVIRAQSITTGISDQCLLFVRTSI